MTEVHKLLYIVCTTHIQKSEGIRLVYSSEEKLEATNSLEKDIRLNVTEEEISKDSSGEISKQELLQLTESQEGEKDENVLTGLVNLKKELAISEEVIGKRKGKYIEI